MNDLLKSEKIKHTVDKAQKKIVKLTKLSKEYESDLKRMMKKTPYESAGIIFIIGLVLGLIIGMSRRRRD